MTDEAMGSTPSVLAGAALLLRQRTFEDISYADIAELADVSERTVYRRFPTRSHLLEALAVWIDDEHLPLGSFHTLPEFRAAVHARFRAYDAQPALAFVAARGAALSPTGQRSASVLTEAIVAMLAETAPHLNRRDALRAAATLRSFASAMYWARLRTSFDADAATTSRLFDRVVDRVLPVATGAARAA